MLQKDGLYYTFVHREFQEYFAAIFISRQSELDLRKLFSGYSDKGGSNVYRMFYEITPHLVEKYLIIPTIARWLKKTQLLDLNQAIDLRKFMKLLVGQISIDKNNASVSEMTMSISSEIRYSRWHEIAA